MRFATVVHAIFADVGDLGFRHGMSKPVNLWRRDVVLQRDSPPVCCQLHAAEPTAAGRPLVLAGGLIVTPAQQPAAGMPTGSIGDQIGV